MKTVFCYNIFRFFVCVMIGGAIVRWKHIYIRNVHVSGTRELNDKVMENIHKGDI